MAEYNLIVRRRLIVATYFVAQLSIVVGGEVRGRVVDTTGQPVVLANATLTRSGTRGADGVKAQVDRAGRYIFHDVADGEYELLITAASYRNLGIRDIQVNGPLTTLPAIQIEFEGPYACDVSDAARADYYVPKGETDGPGAVAGVIQNEQQETIPGVVVLFKRGIGQIGAAITDERGKFEFLNLSPSQNYWITISAPGHFADEITGVKVQAGFESVFVTTVESCSPGKCQPHLKTVRVRGGCA